MKKRVPLVPLVTLFILGFSQELKAQSNFDNSVTYVWLDAGAGISSKGFGGKMEVLTQISGHLLSLRAAMVSELLSKPLPIEATFDISLLYGVVSDRSRFLFTRVSLGPGLVSGNRRGKEQLVLTSSLDLVFKREFYVRQYENNHFSTVGLAYDAQAVCTPLSWLGLGIDFVGNINSENNYYCVFLSVYLGKVN